MPLTAAGFRSLVIVAGLLCSPALWACTVSATGMQFGTVDPLLPGATDSTSTVSVTCPSLTSYSISLSAGAGSFAERLMRSGSHSLAYNLYADASRTAIWGDGTSSTTTVSGSADSNGTLHTVYGRLPHQPAAIPAAYSDSIVVTVTF